MTRSRIPSALVLGFVLILTVVAERSAPAQTTTSTLEGRVTDATGAVLPGVTVEVKGATVTRTVTTDQTGHYRAVALPAGSYVVTVSQAGFKSKVLQGITLHLDRTVVLDIPMEVAPRAESVTVTAEVPLLDTTTSSTKDVIDSRLISNIPLNGRNYLDLIQLLPGVATNENASYGTTARDTRGSILGERGGNATYLIDGLENNDDFHGGVLQAFTQDAIQEFEVIEAGYKAEFGRGSGGVVNVITKTGSNGLHGSGFFFVRNDVLDSSNVSGDNPPPLQRYNYGGTLGGPVLKDKSWFFGSWERVQEDRGAIFPPGVPDLLKAGENFARVPQNRDMRAFGKYNHQVTKNNEFRAELAWTKAELQNALATAVSLPSSSLNNQTTTFLGKASLTTIFGPHMFLDSSFGVRDQNFEQNRNSLYGLGQSIVFLDDGTSYDFGPPAGSIQMLRQKYYTAREVLSFYLGERHSLKAGVEYLRTVADGYNGQGIMSVLVTIRPFFEQYGLASFQIPQGQAFVTANDQLSRLRNHGISTFLQDDWKVRSNLTLNLGLRYDYDSKFDVVSNVAPRLGVIFSPDKKTAIQASWGMFYDRYRLGIAQSVPELGGFNAVTLCEFDYPRLTADTLIPFPGSLTNLAGVAGDPYFINTHYGIPVGTLLTEGNVQQLTGMDGTQFLTSLSTYLNSFGVPVVPVEFSPFTGYLRQDVSAAYQDMVRVSKPFRTPYNNTFTVGVRRQLGNEISVGATYVKRSMRDILGFRIPNLAYESRNIGQAITTDGGPLKRTYGPWYSGKYDALILTFQKRFGHRFQMQSNFTWARGTDDLLNSNLAVGILSGGGGSVPTDNLNLEFDRGNSDLLVPHSFVNSGTVELPFGIHFSGVLRATSGVYFTAFGEPKDWDGDGIHMLIVPGTKRNQFRGPRTLNLDMRLEKRFKFRERFSASVLAEVFNLTNARNPALIDNFYVNGAPGPSFGQTRVPLPGREGQLGLKFEF